MTVGYNISKSPPSPVFFPCTNAHALLLFDPAALKKGEGERSPDMDALCGIYISNFESFQVNMREISRSDRTDGTDLKAIEFY